jgi:hypothetical protein
MRKLFKELKYRFFAKSPAFWKGVRKIAVSIGSAALAIILAERHWMLGIDPQIISVCGYIVAVCAGMGLSAQLTTNTPNNEKTDDRA